MTETELQTAAAPGKPILKVTTETTIRPVILDYGLKLAALILFLLDDISVTVFFILQAAVFFLVVIFSIRLDNKTKAKLKVMLPPKYQDSFAKLDLANEASNAVMILYLVTGGIASFALFFHCSELSHWYSYLELLLLTGFFSFMGLVFAQFASTPTVVPEVVTYKVLQPEAKESLRDVTHLYPNILPIANEIVSTVELPEDLSNDIKIGDMESRLKDINTKVDAYLLESVFLGGLAFSAFVASAAGDHGVEDWSTKFDQFMQSFWTLKDIPPSPEGKIFHLFESPELRHYLFALTMLESLIASVFFLLVLTLRLRFSNLSLKMDYLVRILVSFNAKEEELINLRFNIPVKSAPLLESRIGKVSGKINEILGDANQLLGKIRPVMGLMSLFRNLGFVCFFIVLLTSGLYFSPVLSFYMLILVIFTLLYRWMIRRMTVQKIRDILMRYK